MADSEPYQERDEEKREACKQHDITLIEIPHYWLDEYQSTNNNKNNKHAIANSTLSKLRHAISSRRSDIHLSP